VTQSTENRHSPRTATRGLARDYDRVSVDRQFLSGKMLVRDLAVAAGERVLDVAAGTGLLAEYIADRVGPTGYVLGVDPLPLRIELAQAKARPNLEFQGRRRLRPVIPSRRRFRRRVPQRCVPLAAEKSGPTAEFARVLKPGGRLGISSAQGPAHALPGTRVRVLARPPFNAYSRPPGGLTHRVDEQEMRQLLTAAGFEVKSIEARESVRGFASPELLVRYSEASSFGNLLAHLPVALRPAAREVSRPRGCGALQRRTAPFPNRAAAWWPSPFVARTAACRGFDGRRAKAASSSRTSLPSRTRIAPSTSTSRTERGPIE